MNRSLHYAAFLVGLAVAGWVGIGAFGSNPLALAITLLIAAFYLMGAQELRRFHQATVTLAQAAADVAEPLPALAPWLGRVHPSLQNAVRLRIEGERVALPGPALTPYLAGLLVLLGMLGTFLGMVVTLNGTGLALDSATDLPAIRASLSAPVKGLGLAFGTSVAGVATSAMLGLMSALCRRERLQAAQRLDSCIATTLRVFSRAHQREASFALLQRQADAMPVLVDRLQSMMVAMERQSEALGERLAAGQARFHGQAESAYAGLAASVDRTLQASLTEGARIAGATIQPVVEATMAGIAREAAALHGTIGTSVQRQLDGLSARLEDNARSVGELWQAALVGHQHTNERLAHDLGGTLERFSETFERRSAALVDGVAARLDGSAERVSGHWREALAQHEQVSQGLARDTEQALAAAAAGFEQRAASLLATVDQAHATLQGELAAREQQRLAAWTAALEAMAAALQQQWQQAGAQALDQQQQVGRALAETARDIGQQAEAHARSTIAEVGRLMQAASDAPRAAAEVIAELRQQLSAGLARDNAMLDERGRILQTLGGLLDTVNHAATEQRAAIDALVSASSDVLDRAGARFSERADAESDKMAAVAAQITGSAVEVASLGEAFGHAVQLFSESNEKLVAHLQRIEGALAKSLSRSDEQLAYYVAQAREVIDLSITSQKGIVEDLQQLASQRAGAVSEA